ncbi:hypothetical protein JRQ81_014439 [Phrynocephalus forsythii]|uniref:Lipid-binding serum glycoprotein N-terminal domain-containing protein n=1 Tax=Phrynocephalus forsythii TaxID=171643 RepID=A0A9Q0XWP0_9SAUR|nr:hypothetical protein JRQ81_014439 [Phrynocephalus forsythii]
MDLDIKRPRTCLLWLLACGWVALSKATDDPCVRVKIDEQSLQATAKTSLAESHIMEEMAETATKRQGTIKVIKGIKGLKVKDIKPPIITTTFLPDKGIFLVLFLQITVSGKSFIGGTMEVNVAFNMKIEISLEKDPKNHLRLEVDKCTVEVVRCKTNLPSSMLPKIVNKFLNSTLGKVLPGMMCPAADKVVMIMAERMDKAFAPYDMGGHGTMHYELVDPPELNPEYISLCLTPKFHDQDGKDIGVPHEPPLSDDLPEKKNGVTQVILPVNIINAMMEVFTQDFSCQITTAESAALTTDKLAEVLPSIKDTLPPSQKVNVEISPQEAPEFSLAPEEASLIIHSTVNILIQDTGEPILSFRMTQAWETKFSLDHEKMKTESYEVRTSDITDCSPSVDEADVEALKEYMREIDALVLDVTPNDNPPDIAALKEKIVALQEKHQ